MFFAEAQIRVHLYGQPTDMRKSYDGLQALARHAMSRDPLDGALYIFVNRRGSQIKCLYFDRSGFCIWGKRLESGTIHQRLALGANARDGLDGIEVAAWKVWRANVCASVFLFLRQVRKSL